MREKTTAGEQNMEVSIKRSLLGLLAANSELVISSFLKAT